MLRDVVEDTMPGRLPAAVPRQTAQLTPDAFEGTPGHVEESQVRRERVVEPDPTIYGGRELSPREAVRLGAVGTFRDQRYVELVFTPVRFDPRARGLRVARSLNVSVEFQGDAGARSNAVPDPRTEDLYRDMFANYGQGTTFRIGSTSTEFAVQSAPAAPLAGLRYRIRVRTNGVVRLDFTRLSGTGFEAQPLSTYKLTDRGVEVPLLVFDANTNDQLNAGDWVEFYGQALDDEPKTVLNTFIPGGTSFYEARDFSDENVYFLTTEAGSRSRLATRNAPPDLSAPATKFDATVHVETDDAFRPLGAADSWYSAPSQSNPTVSGSPVSRSQPVVLPGIASGTDAARVLVRLRGLTEDAGTTSDHRSKVTLLNSFSQAVATNNDDGTFDGRTIYTHDFTWTYPGSGPVLTNPASVTIDALAVAGSSGYKNNFILDFVEIRYKRTFQASADALTFDYPDGNAEFQVTGLLDSFPDVWEITGRVGTSGVVAPVRVTGGTVGGGAGNFSMRFHMTQDPAIVDGTPRRFVVFGGAAVSIPASADFTPDTVSDLRNASNQADLIVIAHPTALGVNASATLNSLLAWKLANQGITSKVAMIQDVYDEFGDGLASPQAIKTFLAFTLSTNPGEGWSGRRPFWVLLIGDGSYDYKYSDTSVPPSSFVPTQIVLRDDPSFGFYASDSLLADVAGLDEIPDLVVGRIPTRTDAQTNTVLQKLLDYQKNPPAGAWQRHAVFVSDRGKDYSPSEAQDFADTNTAGRNWLKLPPNTQRTLNYWTGYCGSTQSGCNSPAISAMRADIKKAFNGTLDAGIDGAAIVQYVGHGNYNVWSDDAFFAEGWSGIFDVNNLANGVKAPWLIAHNCLTAGFQDTNDATLGENLLKRAGGGTVGVFAPSGLNDGYSSFDIADKIWGSLFGPTKERVMGNTVAATMNFVCGLGIHQACQNFVLLGDPTTRMIFPTIQPPTQVQASAGNAVVNVTWIASTTSGATYDVYRSLNTPGSGYAKLNGPPVTSTNYADLTALNAKTYYYFVVALNAESFESRWSNFNSDCAVSGPDCVTATPLNPNPPAAPTGLAITDPETGAKLTLSWNASPEPDFDHYTVFWGTAPGVYTASANTGKVNSYTMNGLENGTTYFIVLRATNTSDHDSAPSPEQPGVPTFVRGFRSPRFITNLRIDKSGLNALLTWAPVTTDIYGKATTVTIYEVFRGTIPNFVPSPANRIGQPTTAAWTDVAALSFANPNYHYLVRAIDVSGNVGGLGNQLPNGVDALALSKTPDGLGGYSLGFSWPAVTTDFDGHPLPINHYEVYGTNHPFTRADVKNGLVPLLASPTTASFSVTAPLAAQYYSVLAVDARGNKSSF